MRPSWRWPLAILAGALALRLLLFTGIQGSDDRLYSEAAWRMARGEPSPGPDLFRTRVAYVGPVAALYALFGPHFAGLILPSLVASLALVVLAYRMGLLLYSPAVAVGAALFAAVIPLDVFYATTASTDLPLAALIGAGAWLLCEPVSPERAAAGRIRAVLAGLAWGAAHLTKESGLLLVLPLAFLAARRAPRSSLVLAAAAAGIVMGLELLFYAATQGNALHRMQMARTATATPGGVPAGFLQAASALPSLCLNPTATSFIYTGGLMAVALAGAAWALLRDRARSGPIAGWWLGGGLLVAMFPYSLIPYRAALQLQPRMFAVLILPGALLASAVLVHVVAARSARTAWIATGAATLLSLACAIRLHQDAKLWRLGVEWAYARMAEHPGATVVSDPRSAEMLRMMSSYVPAFTIRGYRPGDPPPVPGTLLLEVPRQAAASRDQDGVEAPPWWSAPHREVADLTVPAPWRWRGSRGSGERTVLRRVSPD